MADPVVIVTSGTGSGSIPTGTVAQTPGALPDIVIRVVSPLAQILVRAGKTYFNSVVGFLTAGGAGAMPQVLTPNEGWHFLAKAATLAIFPAVFSIITNLAILFGQWDQKFPTLQA